MAKEKLSIGLETIKLAPILLDGGMGTALAALGYTYEDTCVLTQEEAETTEFYAEEVDDPVAVISKKGRRVLEWAIMDWKPSVLKEVLGGTTQGTGAAQKWLAPSDLPNVERSIELVTKTSVKIEIPRAKIEGRLDATFSKKELALIRIRALILEPTKPGEASVKITAM